MNSTWLNEHTEQVKKKQQWGYGEKKKAVIIIAVICLILIGIVFAVGASNPNYNAAGVAAFIVVVGIVLGLVLLSAGKKGSDRDAVKRLRENLERLLTTPEQVAEFDYEMSCEPLCDFDTSAQSTQHDHVIFTEHYIGIAGWDIANLPDYRFARRTDIREMRFAVTRNETKAYGLGKAYIIDLLDSNGEICLRTTVYGRDYMDRFEEVLKQFCEGIRLQEHKLL